jgi:glutamyl-tRNA(Gln) amidotransferase subunit D
LAKYNNNGGYRGVGLELLAKQGISVGDNINITTEDGEASGVLMPRYESSSEDYVVIKLRSGYNTGIHVEKIKSIIKLQKTESASITSSSSITTTTIPAKAYEILPAGDDDSLPRVALISTGGTIASKIDYRTGGVYAALTASELYSLVPELACYASIEPEVLLSEYSENLKPDHWTMIAEKVVEKVKSGKYRGIVISHGTDTMHYTATALSFALQKLPIPIVLVGAQRSSDRPSSDAALNLLGATIFAIKSENAGVFVAMHASTSDDTIAFHIGTRVRKNHTSRRDAFESIDVTPVAFVKNNGSLEIQKKIEINLAKRRSDNQIDPKPKFDSRVALLKYHPGFDPKLITYATGAGYKVIILEGTGLGHVSKECFPALQKAIEAGIVVCMTSQCIWGRVKMTVYDTGRDLLGLGIIPLSDMISETATVKAMWALANTKDIKQVMQENIANEISLSIPI